MNVLNPVKSKNPLSKLIFRFYILLLFTAGIIYFMPKEVSILFLLYTLVKYFRSKNDYFWFAYAFILTFDIGGLFFKQTWSLLSLGSFDIYYLSLFSVVSFIKYLFSTKVQLGYLRTYYYIYLLLFLVLLTYGLSAYGILGGGASGYRYLVYFLSATLYFPLAITIPKSIDTFKKITLFSVLMISLIPLNLLGQIYVLLHGISISTQYGVSGILREGERLIESERILRPVLGATPLFFAFIMSLFFYSLGGRVSGMIKRPFLLVFVLLNFLSIFISATRGWIITYLIILIMVILFNLYFSRGISFAIRIIIVFIVGFVVLYSIPVFRTQFDRAHERLLTVEMIVQGDATAGGTLSRLTTRHDRIMEYYDKNSKLLGTGISNEGLEAFDQHVGNQSMLVTGGLIEVFVTVFFLFYIISKTILINKNLHPSNSFKNTILNFIFFLIGLLAIHSSSSFKFGVVGWIKFPGAFIVVILFFTIYNRVLIEAKCKNQNKFK